MDGTNSEQDFVTSQVNVSDSAPILNLNQNQNSVYHDLRNNAIDEVSTVQRSLRTIPGVLLPVCLSMCSVAIFLRVGFVVGSAGFWQSLGLYLCAFSIFLFTGLSVCAISTNGAIQGGGVYYMISRALGPEFGGAIGTLFFIANAIGSGFNTAGLVESFLIVFGQSQSEFGDRGLPESHWWKVLYGTIFNLITLIVALVGANLFSLAVSFIFVIMFAAYMVSVFSIFIRGETEFNLRSVENATGLFTGMSINTLKNNFDANYTLDYTNDNVQTSFGYLFSVLFSSMVGVMAGANMSGELKKPSKSIPRGTMVGIFFVFAMYLVQNLLLAASCERKLLVGNASVLQDITYAGYIIIPIGLVATTWSGALSSMLGSSRVLQALAEDELFGPALNYIKRGISKKGNPYIAVLCSYLLSQMVLFIGSLNAIAPLVTIFYLLAYFGINLAVLAMDLASAPNFRPTFRYFGWQTALFGMFGTLIMTFITSVVYASIAIGLLISLIVVLYFRDFPPEWGSISQALIFHQVRKYLLLLDTRKDHVKFWRPQILLLISNPRSCLPLIEFGNDVKKGGLFVLGHVKTGELNDCEEDPLARDLPLWMNLVDDLKVKAFIELTLSNSIKDGINNLVRISGLGGMKPNTVMLGFYDNAAPRDLLAIRPLPKKRRNNNNYGGLASTGSINGLSVPPGFENLRGVDEHEQRMGLNAYVEVIRDILKMKKNLAISRNMNTIDKIELKSKLTPIYIDVWPINFLMPELCSQLDSTSLFMLQLACILNMVSVWKRATLRVFLCSTVTDAAENDRRKSRLEDLLAQLRIHALTVLVPMESVRDVINRPLIKEEDLSHYQSSYTSQEVLNVSDVYLKAVNQMVKNYSEQASLCFLYLPAPPKLQATTTTTGSNNNPFNDANSEKTPAFITTSENDLDKCYIRMLETVSEGLPPTVYINGVNCVTSTQL